MRSERLRKLRRRFSAKRSREKYIKIVVIKIAAIVFCIIVAFMSFAGGIDDLIGRVGTEPLRHSPLSWRTTCDCFKEPCNFSHFDDLTDPPMDRTKRHLLIDKATYQMNLANRREAAREAIA